MEKLGRFIIALLVIFYSWLHASCDPFDMTSVGDVVKFTNNITNELCEKTNKSDSGNLKKIIHKLMKIKNKSVIFENDLEEMSKSDSLNSTNNGFSKLYEYFSSIKGLFEKFLKIIKVSDEAKMKNFTTDLIKFNVNSRSFRQSKMMPKLKKIVPLMIANHENVSYTNKNFLKSGY